jgi:hypothetical protein
MAISLAGGSWSVHGSGNLGCELRNLLSSNNFGVALRPKGG